MRRRRAVAQVLTAAVVVGTGLPVLATAAQAADAPRTSISAAAAAAGGKPSKDSGGGTTRRRGGAPGELSGAQLRAAADGSTAAAAYGVSAGVSILGAAAIGTQPTPVSDWPAGPAQATTVGVGVSGLISTGAVTTTATGDDLKDTAAATSTVDDLGTGTGLQGLQMVTADTVESRCTGTGAGVSAVSTVIGLKLNGVVNTSAGSTPAPNSVITIAGVGTLTLNEQTTTNSGGKRTITTNALHLRLLGGALSPVGQGDVIVGRTTCTTTNAVVPSIGSRTPTSGPTTGGTAVVITGTGFRGATDVRFGGVQAQYTIDSPTQITAIAPAHAAGAVDLTVATGAGTSPVSTYTYVAAPTVTSISPTSGLPAGGTTVTITGSGFTAGSSVSFGSTAAGTVTYLNPTTLSALSPAGSGTVDVRVTTGGVTSATGDGTRFSYLAAPTLSAISPSTGPSTGGTTVIVTGTNFTAEAEVTLDGVAQPTTYVSASELSFVTPAGSGTAAVGVTRGTATSGTQTFGYVDPSVSGLSPNHGPITGGTSVTAAGSDLDLVTAVSVDGTAATITAQPANGSSLTFLAPPHLSTGAVTVVFTGPGATTTSTTYTYDAIAAPPVTAPVIASINPTSGPLTAGPSVTILGANLDDVASVTFGGLPATVVSFDNLFGLSAVVTPPDATVPGPVTVVVTDSNGDSSMISLGSTYTYVADTPTVTGISPAVGPVTGGTEVSVGGTGFVPSSVVVVNGVAVPTSFVSASELRFTTLPGTGTVNVGVRTGAVSSAGTQPFSYALVPVNAVAAPLTGPIAGGTTVTVTGSTMGDVDTVVIGGASVAPDSVAAGQVVFTTPAHPAGAVTIALEGDFGTGLLPNLFLYTAPVPTISSVAPASGPIDGGYTVTLTGTGFAAPATVFVGGSAATNVTVVDGTTLTFTMPAGLVPGAAAILVTTPGGAAGASFDYGAAASVSSIAPVTGPTAGGTQVTLTGTGFTGASSVTVDATVVPAITVTGDSTITFDTPAHAAGAVGVVVNGAGGDSIETMLFTYLPADAAPTIGDLSPGIGTVDGGTRVTITGTSLLPTTGVTFDGIPATDLTVVNGTTVLATSPAHTAGPVDVVVTTPLGSSTPGGTSQFVYAANDTVAVVDTITPASGSQAGGTHVMIRGLGMQSVDQVTFDGTPGTDITVADNTMLSVITPAHAAGAVGVVLRNATGTSTAYQFTYVPLAQLPTVSDLTPNVGPTAGGTRVTITGTGFDANTTVSFDSIAGTDIVLGPDVSDLAGRGRGRMPGATRDRDINAATYQPVPVRRAIAQWRASTSNTLQVTTPTAPAGPTTVVVTNSAGAISFVSSFTFIPVLAATATIEVEVGPGSSTAIAPVGPDYSGLRANACSDPTGSGSAQVSGTGLSCVYTAADEVGTDSFVMSVVDDLGQSAEQTVQVTVVDDSDGGGGTGGGGGNDTGEGGGTGGGGGGGNSTGEGDGPGEGGGTGGSGDGDLGAGPGGGLAFTGTPLLLIPGLVLGLTLVLLGVGLLVVEQLRLRRAGDRPVTRVPGRQLIPEGPESGRG